jgi:hypothetical protein
MTDFLPGLSVAGRSTPVSPLLAAMRVVQDRLHELQVAMDELHTLSNAEDDRYF